MGIDTETTSEGKKEHVSRCEGQKKVGPGMLGRRDGRSGHLPKDTRESKEQGLYKCPRLQRWTRNADVGTSVERLKIFRITFMYRFRRLHHPSYVLVSYAGYFFSSFFFTVVLSSFCTSRGHRCRPFSPLFLIFNFCRA